jgi:eukaryotic-like serine/threonine-protein kinase
MTVKISQNSFVQLLEKSGLIDQQTLSALVDQFQRNEAGDPDEGELLAQFLIRKGELTTWQARKLLQGKHRGFQLGKYRLLSLLGRGGMSSVYLAEHKVMRRRCAIKVLPSKQVNNRAALDRFHQEAQAVASLDDPNIVRAYDVDLVEEGGNQIHFLVMEYVEGRSLQEIVDQDGPLSIPDAVNFICQAARGLDHAHRAGMVHRDIKPSNLLLDRTGTIKVLDMGLARFFEQTDQQSLTLEHDQRVLGTADYLSPEQAVDSHGVDTRSDIYSLGGTLYFLLTGHPPFPEGTLAQRLLAHQTRQPRPVNEERPDVPPSLVAIIERMMSKSRDQRQPTVGQVRDELEQWLAQQDTTFLQTNQPPSALRKGMAQPDAAPTSDGWSCPPIESFTPTPQTGVPHDSNVVEDPDLGRFLTSLSNPSEESEREAQDSDRINSARTVVSIAPPNEPPRPVPPRPAGSGHVHLDTDSVVRRSGDSASVSGSRIRGRRRNVPGLLLGGAAGVCALLIGAYFLLFSDEATPPGAPTAAVPDASATPVPESPTATESVPPPPQIEPGSDITVGREGHFATIGQAIAYVQDSFQPLSAGDQRTIRVAGGATYAEAIVIDNSQFGAFPQGVRIVCEDAQPAVLAPPGTDPIVHLINVERFVLQGFELAGADRPVAMRVQGPYLVGSAIEQLTIHGVQSVGIEVVGVSGVSNRPVTFRDIAVSRSSAQASGISLRSGDVATRELLFHRCRLEGDLAQGVRVEGDVSNVQIRECRFDKVTTPILFADAGQALENVAISNNTFRRFDSGIRFAGLPQIGGEGVSFEKNLFAGVGGPEVVVAGAGEVPLAALSSGAAVRFNWTEQAAGSTGVDIFADNGRRGVDAIDFANSDSADAEQFLKPRDVQLRTAAASAPNPKFIGAVPPGN